MSSQLGAAKRLATELLEDPAYKINLRKRLIDGEVAPHLEVLLWHYRFGKPVDQVVVKQMDEDLTEMSTSELLGLVQRLEQVLESEREQERRTNDAVPAVSEPVVH